MAATGGQITVEIVAVDKFSQPMGTAGQKAQQLGQTAGSAASGVSNLDKALGSTATSSTKAGQGMQQVTDKTKQLGQAQTTAASSGKSMGVAIAGIGTSMVGLATQVMSLGNTYDELNDAQLRINSGATRIKAMTKGVETATIALQKAQQNEATTAEELAVKEDAVTIAKERLSNAINNQNDLIEGAGRAWQQFGVQIAGTVLQSVGGLTTAFGALSSSGIGAGKGLTAAGGGAKGLLTTLGPIAITVAALGAAFLAIKNNTFGFRDALSELGLKLGTAVPALQPLLNFLKQLGGFLGIAGDESATLKDSFLKNITMLKDEALKLFTELFNGAKWFVDQMLQAFDAFAKGNWAEGFGVIKQAFLSIINNETLQAFVKSIVDWVSNTSNWTALATGIIQAFQGIIKWTVEDVTPMVEAFVQSIVDFVTDVNNWTTLWDALVKAWTDMQQWADVIMDFLKPFTDELVAWFEDAKNWEELWKALVDAWTNIKEWWNKIAVPWMEGLAKELETWAKNAENWKPLTDAVASTIGGAIQFTATHIAPLITSFFKVLKDNIIPSTEDADAMAYTIVTGISDAIQKLGAALGNVIVEMIFGKKAEKRSAEYYKAIDDFAEILSIDTLEALIAAGEKEEAKKKMDEMVQAIIDYMKESFRSNVEGYSFIAGYIWDGLILEINKAIQARGKEINDSIRTFITMLQKGIEAASKTLSEVGGTLVTMLVNGINVAAKVLSEVGGTIWSYIATGLNEMAEPISKAGETIITKVRDGAIAVGNLIVDVGKAFWTWLNQGLTSIWQSLTTAGNTVVTTLSGGITEKSQDIIDAITKPFTDAVDGIKKAIQPIIDMINGAIEALGKLNPFGGGGGGGGGSAASKVATLTSEQIKKSIEERELMYDPYGPYGFRSRTPAPQQKTQYATLGGAGTEEMEGFAQSLMMFDPESLMGQIEQLITGLQQLITQLQLLQTALQANATVFQAWAAGINTVIGPLAELIVAFCQQSVAANLTLISTALQANAAVWVSYGEGINTAIQSIAELIVAFCQESVAANLTLISTALQANATVWYTWGEGLNTALQPLAELWVAFVNETVIANLVKMQEALVANQEIWLTWATQVGDIITLIATALAQFIEDVFTTFNEEVIAGLETQVTDGWNTWAEGAGEALVLIGNGLDEFFNNVFAPWTDGIVESLKTQAEEWQTWADALLTALEDVTKGLEDFISNLEDTVTALEDVAEAADAAKEAVEAIPDEKVIHVSYDVEDKPQGLRYGGAFLSNKMGYQTGGSFIVNRPQTFRGKKIGEFNKMEMVTVTPLSNPYNAQDKGGLVNAPSNMVNVNPIHDPLREAMFRRSGKERRHIRVNGILNATLVLPDGRLIARIVNPYIMQGQDADV